MIIFYITEWLPEEKKFQVQSGSPIQRTCNTDRGETEHTWCKNHYLTTKSRQRCPETIQKVLFAYLNLIVFVKDILKNCYFART